MVYNSVVPFLAFVTIIRCPLAIVGLRLRKEGLVLVKHKEISHKTTQRRNTA